MSPPLFFPPRRKKILLSYPLFCAIQDLVGWLAQGMLLFVAVGLDAYFGRAALHFFKVQSIQEVTIV